MNLTDLTLFNRAIELAEDGNNEAAHQVLAGLRAVHPHNSRVLLCYAYTASDRRAAGTALAIATSLDPANPALKAAERWLQRQAALTAITGPLDNVPDLAEHEQAAAPVELAGKAITLQPAALPEKRSGSLKGWWYLWLFAVFSSLLSLGAFFYGDLSRNNELAETEKIYWQEVREINLAANAANLRLQELAAGERDGPEHHRQVSRQLQVFIELSERYKKLFSPSTRFDRLDGLLGLAYNYYGEGAALIQTGLSRPDKELIEQGNLLINQGNAFLKQAREELARLQNKR